MVTPSWLLLLLVMVMGMVLWLVVLLMLLMVVGVGVWGRLSPVAVLCLVLDWNCDQVGSR